MFDSLQSALEKAKPIETAALDGAAWIEEKGIGFSVKTATAERKEESIVSVSYELTSGEHKGSFAILWAVPPKDPLYKHDKNLLSDIHKKYSPKGTSVKDVDFYKIGGKLVVGVETVMPVMGIKMQQYQLLFDTADKQVSVTVCSPDKKFPLKDVFDEILHSIVLPD